MPSTRRCWAEGAVRHALSWCQPSVDLSLRRLGHRLSDIVDIVHSLRPPMVALGVPTSNDIMSNHLATLFRLRLITFSGFCHNHGYATMSMPELLESKALRRVSSTRNLTQAHTANFSENNYHDVFADEHGERHVRMWIDDNAGGSGYGLGRNPSV